MRRTPITFVWSIVALVAVNASLAQEPTDWASFRGNHATGVAEGFPVRATWNADAENNDLDGVLWQVPVPGLGHSSPVVVGNRVFLLTAVAESGEPELQVGSGGNIKAAKDSGDYRWVVLCYDKTNGKELWRQTANQGFPKVTRHTKATHANTSVCVSGDNVVAFFGSEGLYCYDLAGKLKWSRDLGVINVSKYGIGWGYASSPVIQDDRIVIVCDDPADPYIAALRLSDGEPIWRVTREGICERSWGTPLIHPSDTGTQVVVNGWPWIVSYELETGSERWRLQGGGDNPVPTPFVAHDWIYITSAHGGQAPIYVIRPEARGNLSEDGRLSSPSPIVWSVDRGGSYMSTPVVYGDYLYLGNSNGVVRCFHAKTGEKIYEERLGKKAGVIASLVAADEKIFCASENGTVYVLRCGPKFEVLSENAMAEPVFASPAMSEGVLFFRTTKRLVAIK